MSPIIKRVASASAIYLASVIVTAWVVGNSPALKNWIQKQWGDTPKIF